MTTIIDAIKKALNVKPKRLPTIDEVWCFRVIDDSSKDPWERKDFTTHSVTIIDVKNGWVRYKWNGTSLWQDERMQMRPFLHCYQFESTVAWERLKHQNV